MASIVLFSPDLSRHSVYVPWQFMGALERTHKVTLVGPASGPLWAPLKDILQPSAVLPGRRPRSRGAMDTAMRAAQGADLLYAFKALPESLGVALEVGRELDVPVALHLCDWDGGFFADRSLPRRFWYGLRGLGNPVGPFALWGAERLIPRADALTVSTRALQRRFGGTRVPQGVDTARMAPERFPREEARTRLGLRPHEILLLFLGTPAAHKGLQDVARAVGELGDPNVRFMIVGADPSRPEALGEAGVEGAELRPPVPLDEAPWYVTAADIFLVPQRPTPYAQHQLPAKLLLAMAMGAPVLATDVGDALEILGGDPPAGRVVPPSDKEALGAALAEMVGSADLRRAMGREGRRRAVDQLSWDAMERLLGPVLLPLLPA